MWNRRHSAHTNGRWTKSSVFRVIVVVIAWVYFYKRYLTFVLSSRGSSYLANSPALGSSLRTGSPLLIMGERSFLLIIEFRRDLLAPIILRTEELNYWEVTTTASQLSENGNAAQFCFRGADFELVNLEETTGLVGFALQVGGLWIVTHPQDSDTEKEKARKFREKCRVLLAYPSFAVTQIQPTLTSTGRRDPSRHD